MMRRLLERLGASLFVIWAVLSLTFVINYALPADPARTIAGPQARPADVLHIRKQLGLDRPLGVQYLMYFRRLVHLESAGEHRSCASVGPLHLDLGVSYQRRHMPVVRLIGERLPRTVQLAVAAVFLQVLLGTIVGTYAALRRGRWTDRMAIVLTLFGISAPTFLTGLVLQYWLAYRFRLLPIDGYGTTTAAHLRSLVLPAVTLGLFGASFYARFVRDELIGVLNEDFIRTAIAKGLPRWRVIIVHALRNALMPLTTVVGMDLGALVGGAIVTEKLFRWPGLGSLSVDAVMARDGPVIMGIVLLTSVAMVVANVCVDGLYALLDPRVRRPGLINR